MANKNNSGRQQILSTLNYTGNEKTLQLLTDYEDKYNCVLIGCMESDAEFVFESNEGHLSEKKYIMRFVDEIEEELKGDKK